MYDFESDEDACAPPHTTISIVLQRDYWNKEEKTNLFAFLCFVCVSVYMLVTLYGPEVRNPSLVGSCSFLSTF